MRALIIANGEGPSKDLVRALRDAVDTVIAADGGADVALAAGVVPDFVVGDLDSVSEAARLRIPAERFHLDADPEATDLQKTIRFAIEKGASEVDIVAWGGGRADHALANLSVLVMFRGLAKIRLVDDAFEVSLVDGSASVSAAIGTVVSIVAIGPCTGVTTTGLRWNLEDEPLSFSPRGIHNEVASSPATVSVLAGNLLLFRGRWVEKHR